MACRLTYFGCIVLAAGILSLGICPWPGTDSEPVPQETRTRAKQLPLQIQHFRYVNQDNNRIVYALQAEQLLIRPRRFMVFNIKSVNEAVLKNARFETHFYEETAMHTPLFDYQEALPFNKGTGNKQRNGPIIGLVTRLIAKGVRLDIFREEMPVMVLVAEYGLVENKKSEAEFINGIIKDSCSDRFIRSSRILWDDKIKVFVIPGAYTMSASGNSTNGESIQIDLDFNIKPAVS